MAGFDPVNKADKKKKKSHLCYKKATKNIRDIEENELGKRQLFQGACVLSACLPEGGLKLTT